MKNKLWVRIITWVLVVLMIGSCAYVLLANLFAAHAQESAPDYITVGLMYGSDVTVGFETVSTVGFSVQETVTGAERSFHEIYTIEVPKISVVCDDSLSKSAYTYSILSGDKKCAVGGYHLEVHEDFDTLDDALEMLDIILEKLEEEDSDMQPFLAYIDGVYKVRIGNFAKRSDVAKNAATIPELKSEITLVAALPSDTGVSVVDPETDEILFEYDCGDSSSLGLTALPRGRKKQYLKTPANRLYDGVFVYSRYKTEDTDGVQLVNMLDMLIYGIVMSLFSLIVTAYTENKYLICCIPFMVAYCLTQLGSWLTGLAMQDPCNTDEVLLTIGNTASPLAANGIVSGASGVTLVCYYGVLILISFAVYVFFGKGGADKGA